MEWTRQDKMGLRGILDTLASKAGNYGKLARELGETHRATVNNWRTRGVPIDKVPAVIRLARQYGITVSAGQLNPHAKAMEKA